jgi:glycerol-3-phosphate dehydrogenase subunit C
MSEISRRPSAPPAKGPDDPRYFDPVDLEAECKRAFQICHECRMCVNYCGSFPILFDRVDKAIDERRAVGAEAITEKDIRAVSDACWQCKLCYIKCPYTEDEGAYELLDFPRLLAREKAVRVRQEGVPLVDVLLGEPQLLGKAASGVMAPVSNFVLASRLVRKVQEAAAGISAEFPLPTFADEPFPKWMSKHPPKADPKGEVVLFATCYGEYNTPKTARAAVRVLEHNGYRVRYPGSGQDKAQGSLACCGLPNLDGGDVEAAQKKIAHNVALLYPHVQEGRKVIVIGPSCGYMMKKEWPEYLPTPEVKAVAAATLDVMEFLVVLGKEKRLNRDFARGLGTVAYHAACHLRAQKVGFPGQRVLNVVPDTDVRMVEHCSAVDGTWGMKAEHYETGRRYAQKLVNSVGELEPDVVLSDCSLAGLRITHEAKQKVLHPIEAVLYAYGLPDEGN